MMIERLKRFKKEYVYDFGNEDIVILVFIGLFFLFVCFTFRISEIETQGAEAIQIEQTDYNDTYISEEYVEYCEEIGNGLGICPELLIAMIESESSGNPNAINGNCVGLMQVNINVWSELAYSAGIYDAYDPHDNILLGALVLTKYIQEGKYGSDVAWVLMKYNGFSKADAYIESGNMSYYAEKILNRSMELERVHAEQEGREI